MNTNFVMDYVTQRLIIVSNWIQEIAENAKFASMTTSFAKENAFLIARNLKFLIMISVGAHVQQEKYFVEELVLITFVTMERFLTTKNAFVSVLKKQRCAKITV